MSKIPSKLLSTLTGISKSGSAVLSGDATLSEGTGVTLTQVGQDIAIAASGGGGGQNAYDLWVHPTDAGANFTTLAGALSSDTTPKSIIMSAVSAESVTTALTLNYSDVSITGVNHPELTLASLIINTLEVSRTSTRAETAGTVSVTAGSGIITGVGTTFTNLVVGDYIYLGYNTFTASTGKEGFGHWYEIETITNNTSITIGTAAGFRFEKTISAMSYRAGTITKNILIENMLFDGTGGAAGSTSLSIDDCFNVTIRNCIFRGNVDIGINLTDCQGVQVQNCKFEAHGRAAILLTTCDDVIFEGNYIDGANGAAVSAVSGGIEVNESHRVDTVRNTVMNIRKPGILIDGGWNNSAINNKVWNCGDGTDVFRSGILGTGGSSTAYRINQLRIIGNDIRGIRGHGIFVNGFATATVISDNTILECDDTGITCGDVSDTISITGNICRANGSHGIRLVIVTVFNSIIAVSGNLCISNSGSGIDAHLTRGVTLTGNICWANTGNGINSSTAQRHTIVGNSLFVNTAGNLNTAGITLSSVGNNVIA